MNRGVTLLRRVRRQVANRWSRPWPKRRPRLWRLPQPPSALLRLQTGRRMRSPGSTSRTSIRERSLACPRRTTPAPGTRQVGMPRPGASQRQNHSTSDPPERVVSSDSAGSSPENIRDRAGRARRAAHLSVDLSPARELAPRRKNHFHRLPRRPRARPSTGLDELQRVQESTSGVNGSTHHPPRDGVSTGRSTGVI